MTEGPKPPTREALVSVRSRIDEIDVEIARLIHSRAEAIAEVRAAKAALGTDVYDPAREDDVLARVSSCKGPFARSSMQAVFREIISGCVFLQAPASIVYLGPGGTFTERAAHALFGSSASFLKATTIGGVLDAVTRGAAGYGVIPFETSADGMVLGVAEAVIKTSLKIRREYVTDVSYCLCSFAPNLSSIKRVYAHPNTVGQCRAWLVANLRRADLVVVESPVEAMAKAKDDPEGAAIVSKESAALEAFPILADRTTDRDDNAIRFVVLGKEDGLADANRTTIAIRARREESLSSLFGAVSAHKVELLRVTSSPGTSGWDSLLLLELGGKRTDANVQSLLGQLVTERGEAHVLGSYFSHRDAST